MAKAQAEIRSLARAHTKSAIKVLAGIMNEEKAPHSARVAAANSLLDRGWGKALQVITGDEEAPLHVEVDGRELARRIALLLTQADG